MKKVLCLFVVLSLIVVIPFPAYGSTDVHSSISEIVTTLNEIGADADDVDYFSATYDYETNSIIVDMAIDTMLDSSLILIDADDITDGLYLPNNDAVLMYEAFMLILRRYNAENINFVLRFVNDDIYIRHDYSTALYNPLLVVKDGEVVFDIVQEMRAN